MKKREVLQHEIWNSLDINSQSIEERWAIDHKPNVRPYIEGLSGQNLKDLAILFGIEHKTDSACHASLIALPEIEHQRIILANKLRYKLFHNALDDAFTAIFPHGSSMKSENSTVNILRALRAHPEVLTCARLLSRWRKSKRARKYILEDPDVFDEKLIQRIIADQESIAEKLTASHQRQYTCIPFHSFKIDGTTYLAFVHQSSDAIIKHIDDATPSFRRNRGFEIHMARFDKSGGLAVQSKKSTAQNMVAILAEDFGLEYVPETRYVREYDTEKFAAEVRSLQSNLEILNATVRKTHVVLSPRAEIAPPVERDISKSLDEFHKMGAFDATDFSNYIKIRFRFKNKRKYKVNIEINNEGYVCPRCDLDLHSKLDQEFLHEIESVYGLHLNRWYSPDQLFQAKSQLISFLFNESTITEVATRNSPVVKQLEENRLISLEKGKYAICPSCENNVSVGQSDVAAGKVVCDCNAVLEFSDADTQLHEWWAVKRHEKNTIKQILANFKRLGYAAEQTSVKVNKVEYNMYRMEIPGSKRKTVIMLYFAFENIPPKLINHFKNYEEAVVVVQFGSSKISTEKLESALIPFIDAGEAILCNSDENVKKILAQTLRKLTHSTHERIVKLARESCDQLKQALADSTTLDYSRYEKCVFHIKRYILPSSRKWGDSAIGQSVPDGGVSIHLPAALSNKDSDLKQYHIWDCKYNGADSNDAKGFELNSSHSRAMCDYIRHIVNTPEVRHFSPRKKLDSFIVFANRIHQNKFITQATTILNELHVMDNRNWSGCVSFFETEALIKLYELYVENKTELDVRYPIFIERLAQLLTDPNLHKNPNDPIESLRDNLLRISPEDIQSMIDSVLEEKAPVMHVDPDKVVADMKRKGFVK